MKKVFLLNQENKVRERVVESIKHEIRQYIKRERKKKLPEDATLWQFDCLFGKDMASAVTIHFNELTPSVDKADQENWDSFYVEILSRAVKKSPKENEDG